MYYNVRYQTNAGWKLYLSTPVTYKIAMEFLRSFRSEYVGKPYPNRKGFYDMRCAHLVEMVDF